MASAPHKTLYLIGSFILVLGLIGAAAIYATAGEDSDGAIGYEVVNGVIHPIASGDSKRYRHDLERYGGKMAIVTDEFGNWFSGLWHGKQLAYTLAALSIALSAAIFFVASQLAPDRNPDGTG